MESRSSLMQYTRLPFPYLLFRRYYQLIHAGSREGTQIDGIFEHQSIIINFWSLIVRVKITHMQIVQPLTRNFTSQRNIIDVVRMISLLFFKWYVIYLNVTSMLLPVWLACSTSQIIELEACSFVIFPKILITPWVHIIDSILFGCSFGVYSVQCAWKYWKQIQLSLYDYAKQKIKLCVLQLVTIICVIWNRILPEPFS